MKDEYERPDVLHGRTVKVRTGCGSLYVTINDDEKTGKPIELFLRLGKAGGCASATTETTGRLVSRLLQRGDDLRHIVRQLRGVSCHSSGEGKPSCVAAVAEVLVQTFSLDGDAHDGE